MFSTIIAYLNYRKFDNAKSWYDVNNFALDKVDVSNFKETTFNIFDKQAPFKQKYLRANEAPFYEKGIG